jgi:hypothetical protein
MAFGLASRYIALDDLAKMYLPLWTLSPPLLSPFPNPFKLKKRKIKSQAQKSF